MNEWRTKAWEIGCPFVCRALVLVNSHLAAHKDTGLSSFSLHIFIAEASFLVRVKALLFFLSIAIFISLHSCPDSQVYNEQN